MILPHGCGINSPIQRLVSIQIADALETFSIDYDSIQFIEETNAPKGQAISAGLAAKIRGTDYPFVIMPCDTAIDPSFFRAVSSLDNGFLGAVSTYKFSGDNWSFVKTDNKERVTRITEKVRISELCSTGYYYFKSARKFLKYVNAAKRETDGELYVSNVIRKAIESEEIFNVQMAKYSFEFGNNISLHNTDYLSDILSI